MDILKYLADCQHRVNAAINEQLPTGNIVPHELHKAMRYAALNGGKRIRSAFVYAIGEALDANETILDTCSVAIELIHAFSLVHDDLPAIDNDALRRGKPACHKAFGEATAILAGDALLVLAFGVLAKLDKHLLSPSFNLKMIQILCHYVGSHGMAGGEELDVAVTDQTISLRKLAFIYKLKTSYLLCASVLLGALAAHCNKKTLLANLEKFGIYIGLAFQIHDDIIGLESSTEALGKPQGSDTLKNKPTYPHLIGMEKAKIKEKECFNKAIHFLEKTKIKSEKVIALSELIIHRAS